MISMHAVARLVGLLLAASSSGVHAGSRMFEPLLSTTRGIADGQLEVQRDPVSGALDFVAVENATTGDVHHSLRKRYFMMDVEKDDLVALWPKGVIKACFEREEHPLPGDGTIKRSTAEILGPTLDKAMKLWHDTGGWDKDTFRFDFDDSKCADTDDNRRHRHEYLVIRYDPTGKIMHSSVGGRKTALTDVMNKEKPWIDLGPMMTLTLVGERGGSEWVPAFAHEIGHVLGLYHEQQNPRWWRMDPYKGEIADDKPGFGEHTFTCTDLHDYDDVFEKITAEMKARPGQLYLEVERNRMVKEACRDIVIARRYSFSAASFLPEFQKALWHPRRTEPDYNSIMIYPSRMNGRKIEEGQRQRQIVFRKWDGKEIAFNLSPSEDDIRALNLLYGVKSDMGKSLKLWLGDAPSAFKYRFDTLFKKRNC